jgi:BON domain-containing protein
MLGAEPPPHAALLPVVPAPVCACCHRRRASRRGDEAMTTDPLLSRDQQIQERISEAIEARMPKDAPPIDVAVQGATVTLTGHVANQETKDAVQRMARSVDGVVNVVDNLVIGGGHPLLDWLFQTRNPNQDLDAADSTGEE